MISAATPPPGADTPRRRHRPLRRILAWAGVITLVVGGTVTAAALHGPTQAKLLYYQYQVEQMDLASGQGPGGRVMYRFSPLATAGALDPQNFLTAGGLTAPQPRTIAPADHDHAGDVDDDGCEILPPHTVPEGGAGDPPALDNFNQYARSILTDQMQVLFAHRLTSSNGTPRIVIAQFGAGEGGDGGGMGTPARLQFEILVIEPAGWQTLPTVVTRKRIAAPTVGVAYAVTNCYAGRADSADAGAFHLLVEQGGQRMALTGKLSADGRSVSLTRDDSIVASH